MGIYIHKYTFFFFKNLTWMPTCWLDNNDQIHKGSRHDFLASLVKSISVFINITKNVKYLSEMYGFVYRCMDFLHLIEHSNIRR